MTQTPLQTAPNTTISTIQAEGLLFDMDGVLISSIGSVVRCWRQWCRLYNIPNADTFEVPHGKRAIEIVHSIRPDIDAEEGLRVIEDIELADVADLRVLPGVVDLLRSLPAHRWSIVTSATRRLLIGRLEAAGLPMPDRIIAAEDVEHGKPAPDPYLMGAELLGFAPEDCLVFEDAPAGVAAGVAAGCRVLGVLGTHTPQELTGTTWITPTLESVRVEPEGERLRVTFDALVEVNQ